jgi:hypothetical protein
MPFGHPELIRVATWLKGVVRSHRSGTDIEGGMMSRVAERGLTNPGR